MVNPSLEESNDNGSAETRGSSAKSGSSRPSFTDYWKRTKEAARSITFVSSGPEAQAGMLFVYTLYVYFTGIVISVDISEHFHIYLLIPGYLFAFLG